MKPVWVLAIVFSVLPIAGQIYGDRAGGWLMVDFRAYYCASSALLHREDPYAAAPLHACESGRNGPFFAAPARATVPAPYPPYALALLAPLALLPFAGAAALWWLLLTACALLAAYALARALETPFLVVWGCFALSLGLTALPGGNLMPVCVAALALAAWCLTAGRFGAAAACVAIATIEPHVALPAAIALFIRYRDARVPLAIALGVLGALSLLAAGIATNLTYIGAVIPAHALSEVSRDNQYSLSTIAAAVGFSDARAVAIGGVSYAIAVVAGVAAAMRLTRDGDRTAIVLVPPAIALLGGSFVHTVEIAAAVPAALLLCARASERRWALGVLVLLAVPWIMATSAALFLAPLFPVAYLVAAFGFSRSAAYASAVAALCVIALLFVLAAHTGSASAPAPVWRPPIDPHLAEASWRAFVLGNSTNRPITWLLRLPTWIGLIGLALAAGISALRTTPRLPTPLQPARRSPAG